jgi:hypothetical protein
MEDQVDMSITRDIPPAESLKIEQPEPFSALTKHHDIVRAAVVRHQARIPITRIGQARINRGEEFDFRKNPQMKGLDSEHLKLAVWFLLGEGQHACANASVKRASVVPAARLVRGQIKSSGVENGFDVKNTSDAPIARGRRPCHMRHFPQRTFVSTPREIRNSRIFTGAPAARAKP